MSFWVKDMLPVKFGVYSGAFLRNITESVSNAACNAHDEDFDECRDDSHTLVLKVIAIAAILVAGVCGVSIPLAGRKRRFLQSDSNLFVAAKSFAAGVILATGFVHMLPEGNESLTDSCLPKFWTRFPFSGFIAMIAALLTLLADFIGTQYYERKQEKQSQPVLPDSLDAAMISESGIVPAETRAKVFGEEEGGAIHIVGIHAHAAHHRHSHPHEQGACRQPLLWEDSSHGHSHTHGIREDDENGARHIVVSQVLELGIVSHSVIIGLSLGVSNSPCTIRPLIGALSFHQFFEGFALGGCISQAKFRTLRSTLMACLFALTTPLGIAVGISISSIYNANSPRALVIEGIFDSISAGILVYMALVDLIAADFLSKRMSCNVKLQVVSYIFLFMGAALMSSLALWA